MKLWTTFALTLPFSCSLAWADYLPHLHPATLDKELSTHALPRRSMLLSAQVGGILAGVDLDLGERADGSKGFSIDSTVARLQVDRLESLVGLREAELESHNLRSLRSEKELSHQLAELKRLQLMLESGGATRQQVDQQQHLVEQATLGFKENKALQELSARQLQQARLELTLQKDHLDRHLGRAPEGWSVVSRFKEKGEMCNPGEPVLELAQLSPLRLVFMVSEEEAWAIGQKKATVLDQGKQVGWSLLYLSPQIDPTSRKRRAELLLDSLPPQFCGQELEVRFSLPDPQGGLLLPDELLTTTFGQKFATTKEGKRIPIKVLRKAGTSWVISPDELPRETMLIKESVTEPGMGTTKESVTNPGMEGLKEPGRETSKDPDMEGHKDRVKEPSTEPVREGTLAPNNQSIKDPSKDTRP